MTLAGRGELFVVFVVVVTVTRYYKSYRIEIFPIASANVDGDR